MAENQPDGGNASPPDLFICSPVDDMSPGLPGTVDQRVEVWDGRHIAVSVLGPEWGVPVVTLGGNPSSRHGPHPNRGLLEELGVRLYAVDRAGLGDSDIRPEMTVTDNAADIRDVMNHFGVNRFGILARSGGTPAALAAAALSPERVSALALMGALAPNDALPGWSTEMTPDNQQHFNNAADAPEKLIEGLEEVARALQRAPMHHLDNLDLDYRDTVALLSSCSLPYQTGLGHAYGAGPDGRGWAAHVKSIREWRVADFDISTIKTPTMIWHAVQDRFTPLSHSLWLQSQIEGSQLIQDPEGSHFSALPLAYNGLRFIRDVHIGARRAGLIGPLTLLRLQEYYGRDIDLSQPPAISDSVRGFDANRRQYLDEVERPSPLALRAMLGDGFIARQVVREVITATDTEIDLLYASLADYNPST